QLRVERRLVDGFEVCAILVSDEAAHDPCRSGQRNLEPDPRGNHTLALQPGEDLVGLDCRLRVAEVRQFDVCGGIPLSDANLAKIEVADPDRVVTDALDALRLRDAVGLEGDPVEPVAHLTVRDALELPAERLRCRANGGLGGVEVDAADKVCTLGPAGGVCSHASSIARARPSVTPYDRATAMHRKGGCRSTRPDPRARTTAR